MNPFSASEEKFRAQNPNHVAFQCRSTPEEEPIKLGVPCRALEEQVEERMNRAELYRDLPLGESAGAGKKNFWNR